MGSDIDFSYSPKSSTVLTIPLALATLVAPTTVPFVFSASLELPVTVDGVETDGFSDLADSAAFFSAAFSAAAAAASLLFYLSIRGSSKKWKSL